MRTRYRTPRIDYRAHMDDADERARRGWRDYTPFLLRIYDPIVLGVVARVVWRIPTKAMLNSFRQLIGPSHLEVGPGTGWFLEKSGRLASTSLTILDPNPNVLRHVTQRLRDVPITAVEADVLKPLPLDGPFASAGLNAVLHCLPGPPEYKEAAIRNIAAVLAPDGVLFGATVLGRSGNHTWLAQRVLTVFNRQGGFDNLDDSEAWLRAALERSFASVEVSEVGSLAVFVARNPLSPDRGGSPGVAGDG
jgi:SAM-dependent methyltransferase